MTTFLAAVLLVVWFTETLEYCFDTLTKPWFVIGQILAVAAVWFFPVRAVWRTNLLGRILGQNGSE